jgi:crotonobetainyl-CoA:carnitine CoA-transferase CaiB-like acyl-CoA transferase
MVTRPMEGVRVLEVAQFTYVPSAGAVLADWGAQVIKVEHARHGDAQRGFAAHMGGVAGGGRFAPIMEHPNRGKRSLAQWAERLRTMDGSKGLR